MNNLVSRNPVQRFKQGRKIVKAQSGTKVIATVDGRQFETTIEQARKNGWEYFVPSKQAEFNRNYPYDRYSTRYTIDNSYFPAFIQDARFGDYVNGWKGETSNNQSGLVRDLESGSLAFQPKKVEVPYVPTQKFQSNSSAQDINTQNIQPKTTESQTQSKFNFQDNKSGSQKSKDRKPNPTRKRTTVKKVSTPLSIFSGSMGGWTKSMGLANITDPDSKNMIKELGWEGKTAEQVQQLLNENDIGGYGVTVDNKWGNQSRNALKAYYNRWKDNQNKKSNYISPLNNYTPPTTPINQEVASLNFPQQKYNRTGVRGFIRNKGINPYSFNGAQRRALRMVLNNTADNNDRLLVKEMELFKKGGQLPSRNPIERFKQRNFR